MLDDPDKSIIMACCMTSDEVKDNPSKHHMGTDRTLYLVRKVNPNVSKAVSSQAIRAVSAHRPNANHSTWRDTSENWRRLAIDVTHNRGAQYLTMVDSKPYKFAIWKMRTGVAYEIEKTLNGFFLARGAVDEVLMGNGTAFRLETMREMEH